MRLAILTIGCTLAAAAASKNTSEITFHRDVLPVMQKNCQGCHRPGEAAPMSLLTYKEARPWAKAIREAVLLKRMPPWFADPAVGHFANDRSLKQSEIDTLVAWSDGGAKEGDPKDAPKPLEFVEGWNIGLPDSVFEMPEAFAVPASGTIDYHYVIIPTGFTEDRWVRRAEVRPGNRSVVHHVIAFARPPGSKWLAGYEPGKPFVPKKGGGGEGSVSGREFLVGFAPGVPPQELEPGMARLVKAGSDLVFQLHYTASGKAAKDLTKIGLVFSKEPPAKRVVTLSASNTKFVIPPGDPNYAVDGKMTLQADSELISLLPHMHLRGKAMEIRAVYPTGEKEVLLRVPRYDFNWQLGYALEKPKPLPKGTVIEAAGVFDNSPNNSANPDPTAEVRWGDQSWEEMMIGFFQVALDADKNPVDLVRAKKKEGSED